MFIVSLTLTNFVYNTENDLIEIEMFVIMYILWTIVRLAQKPSSVRRFLLLSFYY